MTYAFGQKGFELNKKKNRISFELVNNLVVIPVDVNGTELSFLLDTGVSNTIIFSLASKDSLEVNDPKWIKVRGLGAGEPISALKSSGNTVTIGKSIDRHHELYFIFEEELNFSKRMGIPIHGIIGYDFFKNFVVKIDYDSKVITYQNAEGFEQKRCNGCETFPLSFYKQKPFLDVEVYDGTSYSKKKLLLDSGSSDALWLFDRENKLKESPKNYFHDFLGLGLSGSIYGERSRINKIKMGSFAMDEVNVAFPDTTALANINFYEERDGTLGADVLRRFTSIIDYSNKVMYLKKNSFYNDPFYYNMSGIIVEHSGKTMVKDVMYGNKGAADAFGNEGSSSINKALGSSFQFYLAPRYVIADVRKESPAAEADIRRGDEIVKINGRIVQKYNLNQLIKLFSSKPGRKISIDINRNGIAFRKKIKLKKVL